MSIRQEIFQMAVCSSVFCFYFLGRVVGELDSLMQGQSSGQSSAKQDVFQDDSVLFSNWSWYLGFLGIVCEF